MRHRVWTLGVLVGAISLLATVPSEAAAGTRTPPGTRLSRRAPAGTLSGVVYLPDGRPAAGAVLRAVGSLGAVVAGKPDVFHTGDRLFTIRANARGRYALALDADGTDAHAAQHTWPRAAADTAEAVPAQWDVFLISQQGIGYASLTLRLEEGQHWAHEDIHLQRGERVSGTVTTADMRGGVGGAKVYAMLDFVKVMRPVVLSQAVTDRAGRFRLPADLPPKVYRIGPVAPGRALLADNPSVTSGAGHDRTVVLPMAGRRVRVHGRALNVDGTPLAMERLTIGVRVTGGGAGAREYLAENPVTTDSQGRFAFVREWDKEEYFPWALAYPSLVVSLERSGRSSEPVAVDVRQPFPSGVVLRLR